jgi:Cd2+/Zn2+-exporting ATPase
VVLALGFMVAGAILEESQPILSFWLFMGSYLFGGIFGFINGFKTLLKLQIDIDFLMVGAAIGAAVIGEPFEGALLLFLFSLSNVLTGFCPWPDQGGNPRA